MENTLEPLKEITEKTELVVEHGRDITRLIIFAHLHSSDSDELLQIVSEFLTKKCQKSKRFIKSFNKEQFT